MSDNTGTAAAIAALQQRERELELDAVAIRGRIEEVREILAQLQHPGRRRARRAAPQLVETEQPPPMRVAGAALGGAEDHPGGDAA